MERNQLVDSSEAFRSIENSSITDSERDKRVITQCSGRAAIDRKYGLEPP